MDHFDLNGLSRTLAMLVLVAYWTLWIAIVFTDYVA